MPPLLRDELEQSGSIFQTTVDSEIILHLLAQPNTSAGVLAALRKVEGAFTLVVMSDRQIIGVRDPFGFRPLVLGKLDGAYILSSETCAFDLIHAEFIREIEPGEVVIIDETGVRSEFPFKEEKQAFCIFEYVYFARPDSIIGEHQRRPCAHAMGRELARLHPVGGRPRGARAGLRAPTRRSVSPRNSAFPSSTPLCAITTSGAPFCSPRN